MEKILLALGALALLGSVLYIAQNQTTVNDESIPASVQAQFSAFKSKYNKKYSSHEDTYRVQVYYNNLQFAAAFNAQKGTEVFGETLFFDLTDEEFAQTYLTEIILDETVEKVNIPFTDNGANVDWRQKGAVTPVKNQGQCGSCWAFSTTGVLEGFFGANGKGLPDLSEQQIVDCATFIPYFNQGCNGGLPGRALNYVKDHPLTTQDKYGYKAVQNKCDSTAQATGTWKISGHTDLQANENSLLGALQQGPVSIAVDATKWQFYDPTKAEVFEDCDSKINHAVLAVGYADDYVLVKNSWSTKWGMDGYIKVKRNQNTCGMFNVMTVPK